MHIHVCACCVLHALGDMRALNMLFLQFIVLIGVFNRQKYKEQMRNARKHTAANSWLSTRFQVYGIVIVNCTMKVSTVSSSLSFKQFLSTNTQNCVLQTSNHHFFLKITIQKFHSMSCSDNACTASCMHYLNKESTHDSAHVSSVAYCSSAGIA